jgi:hypothetical protein
MFKIAAAPNSLIRSCCSDKISVHRVDTGDDVNITTSQIGRPALAATTLGAGLGGGSRLAVPPAADRSSMAPTSNGRSSAVASPGSGSRAGTTRSSDNDGYGMQI